MNVCRPMAFARAHRAARIWATACELPNSRHRSPELVSNATRRASPDAHLQEDEPMGTSKHQALTLKHAVAIGIAAAIAASMASATSAAPDRPSKISETG